MRIITFLLVLLSSCVPPTESKNPNIPVVDADVFATLNRFPSLPDTEENVLDNSNPTPPDRGSTEPKEYSNLTQLFLDGDQNRLIIYTEPSWCAPCLELENDILPNVGIMYGEDNNSKIQVVRTDERTELRKLFTPYTDSVPTVFKYTGTTYLMIKGKPTVQQLKDFAK